MKFRDGYMVKSGNAVNVYVDSAVRHILLKQGVLGIKVKIMLAHDPQGKLGPSSPLSDHVKILSDKGEDEVTAPKAPFADNVGLSTAAATAGAGGPLATGATTGPATGAPQQFAAPQQSAEAAQLQHDLKAFKTN